MLPDALGCSEMLSDTLGRQQTTSSQHHIYIYIYIYIYMHSLLCVVSSKNPSWTQATICSHQPTIQPSPSPTQYLAQTPPRQSTLHTRNARMHAPPETPATKIPQFYPHSTARQLLDTGPILGTKSRGGTVCSEHAVRPAAWMRLRSDSTVFVPSSSVSAKIEAPPGHNIFAKNSRCPLTTRL